MGKLFKDIFIQLLQDNNITAYNLSKVLGISEAVISQWKSGRQLPKYDSINLLCDYFNVSPNYLLGRTDEKINTHYENNVSGINFSNLIHGSGSVTVNSINNDYKKLTKEETEILNVYRLLDARDRTKFMNFIFEMEDKIEKNTGRE